jgi:hypothetical protein
MDGRGPGADLIPDLKAAGVQLLVTSTSDFLDACAEIYDAVETGRLVRSGNAALDEAAADAVPRFVGDRWAFGRRVSTGDISPIESVTLATWATGLTYDPLSSVL